MNEHIIKLAKQSDLIKYDSDGKMEEVERFAQLIVYDFLSELTNDDALGEARIATIKRLAEKWGVAR